jgi:hypothetical protein
VSALILRTPVYKALANRIVATFEKASPAPPPQS